MYTESLTERFGFNGGFIKPQNIVGGSTVNSDAIDMSRFNRAIGIFWLGNAGPSCSWTMQIQQSSINTTSFTSMSGFVTPAMTSANTLGTVEVRRDQMAQSMRYLRMQVVDSAGAGTTNSGIMALLVGMDARYEPAQKYNDTAVVLGNNQVQPTP